VILKVQWEVKPTSSTAVYVTEWTPAGNEVPGSMLAETSVTSTLSSNSGSGHLTTRFSSPGRSATEKDSGQSSMLGG